MRFGAAAEDQDGFLGQRFAGGDAVEERPPDVLLAFVGWAGTGNAGVLEVGGEGPEGGAALLVVLEHGDSRKLDSHRCSYPSIEDVTGRRERAFGGDIVVHQLMIESG